jgi:hypothetical protein
MEHFPEEGFQIATLVVTVVIVLVCMSYLLIFLNPQIALNPFKPPLPTATALLYALQATWTPTHTRTPTFTLTPSRTSTRTLTPPPTQTPTNTRVPTRVPTRRPATPRPPTQPPYPYRVVQQGCYHSGGTFIEGTVWNSFGVPQGGIRVALSSGPGSGDVYYLTTGNQGRSSGYYDHIIRANGAAVGDYYVWVAGGDGRPLSDPWAGHVTINGRGPDDASACWRAVVDFVLR